MSGWRRLRLFQELSRMRSSQVHLLYLLRLPPLGNALASLRSCTGATATRNCTRQAVRRRNLGSSSRRRWHRLPVCLACQHHRYQKHIPTPLQSLAWAMRPLSFPLHPHVLVVSLLAVRESWRHPNAHARDLVRRREVQVGRLPSTKWALRVHQS